jgi:AcrR family transcriptional regulator
MVQYPKQEIKDNIRAAALDTFYANGFKGTTMRAIAERAGIPASLIYTYYKNKDVLFEEIILPVYNYIKAIMVHTEHGDFEATREEVGQNLKGLFAWPRELVILIDGCEGTKFENVKERIIRMVQEHINDELQNCQDYDPMYSRIQAICYVESIIAVARDFKGRDWAERMTVYINKLLFCTEC